MRRVGLVVSHFGGLAISEREPFRCVFVQQVLLGGTQPCLQHTFDWFVLDILVTECPVTNLLCQMLALLNSDGWKPQFRAPLAQQVQPYDPLFRGMVPVV